MIRNIKQASIAICTAAAVFFTTGCSFSGDGLFKQDSSDTASASGVALSSITLPADPTDTFNPYTATTVANQYILPLMYDSLVKLDAHFNAEQIMAKRLYNKDTVVKVTLKKHTFSDGSAVTTEDVKYSLEQAMSSPLYSDRLQNIDEIRCDDRTIQIDLDHADVNFYNCLDVPIVKRGTADGKNDIPIGSGRYILKQSGNNYTLKYNTKHYQKKTPHFKEITLAAVPDAEAIMTSVKTGQVHAMFSDLRDGEIGGLDTKTVPVSLNNLIYIGINAKGVLADSEARRALSLALNRTTILSNGYSSRGTATYFPLNPLFNYGDVNVQGYNLQKADSLLDGLGYDKTDLNGVRVKGTRTLTLTLLYNKDNNYKALTASSIKSALKSAGIDVKLKEVKNLNALTTAIQNGNYDLYLGETRLLNNMDISAFFSDGILGKNIRNKDKLRKAYNSYLAGDGIDKFAKLFFKEIPFIPLLFRSGIVAYSGSLSTEIVSTPSDIYYNILDWK